jgi:hypothetical protein
MKTASLGVESRGYHVICNNFVVMGTSTISLFYKRLVPTFPKSQLEQEYREGVSRVGKKHGKGYESTEARSLTALSVKVEATLFRTVVFSLYVSFSSCRDKTCSNTVNEKVFYGQVVYANSGHAPHLPSTRHVRFTKLRVNTWSHRQNQRLSCR